MGVRERDEEHVHEEEQVNRTYCDSWCHREIGPPVHQRDINELVENLQKKRCSKFFCDSLVSYGKSHPQCIHEI